MQEDDNPYEILGLEMTADEKEIKKAYRKMAMKYHPDKQTTDEEREIATNMFARIAEAYDTLTDPVKRYDWRQAYESRSKPKPSVVQSNVTTTYRRPTAAAPVPPRTSGGATRRPPPPTTTTVARPQPPPPRPMPQPKNRPGLETTNTRPTGPKPPPPPPRAAQQGSYNASTYQQRAPEAGRRKKTRDPFLIFEEVMQEEYGSEYKSKIETEWNQEAGATKRTSGRSLFGGSKSADKKDLPSYKDVFKDIDLNGDKLLSRQELRKFIESNQSLHAVLGKSLNLHPQQSIDIATDVAFSLAKWDGKNEDAAMASYFLTQKNRKNGQNLEMTKDEFKAFYKTYVQSQKGSYDFFLRTMFAAYDLNGDGKLQRKEFENFLEIFYHANYEGKMQMPNKAELVRVAHMRLDKNRDGIMSFSEVRDLLQVAAVLTEKGKK